jgi:hypothetical protein
MKIYRLNAQGNLMAFGLGMWTTLPPKRSRLLLACMSRKQLLNLIQIVGAISLAAITAQAYA